MPTIAANGVELFYEDHGEPHAPPILLIMGLGAQLIFWPDAMVEGLVARGFRVIRYDNRDIGQSTILRRERAPSRLRYAMALFGLPAGMPYGLGDMAKDAVGLMDALGIAAAHVVGASMGGMIAQHLAADHASRVRSLVSIMSSSGRRGLPGPAPAVRDLLMRPRANAGREAAVEAGVRVYAAIGGPGGGGREPAGLRALMARAYDRGHDPSGPARQLGAIIADGSRVPKLQRIRVPALVIHGDADPLVPLAAGRDTAANIPGARLEVIPGMGHDLPPGVVPRITALIADFAVAVDAPVAVAAQ